MFTKHNVHYLRPIYSPETLTFCYLMPFFRVFLPGCRKGHTRHTTGRWARDARDARATGENAGNACMSGVSCAGRAKQAGRAGRAGQAGRTSGARMAHCSICLFQIVRFANMSCIKRTLSHACKGASPRRARPAGYSRKMSICYIICCYIDRKSHEKRVFALFVVYIFLPFTTFTQKNISLCQYARKSG